jgi:hypothetical protein
MSLLHDVPRAVSDRVHLAALELRRARHAFLRMVVLAVVAAILAATAWLAFWAAIVVGLLALGIPWYGVAILVLLLNGLGAWFAIRAASALTDDLTLPATVRRLTVRSSTASQPSDSGPNDPDPISRESSS